MIIANPYEFAQAWGQIELVGFGKLPGYLVEVSGMKRAYEWAVQKGVGVGGASTIFRGQKITEGIMVVLEAPDASSFDSMMRLHATVVPVRGRKPQTFAVVHPLFQYCGVDRVALAEFALTPTKSLSWQFRWTWIEYRPPVIAKVGPAEPAKLPGEPQPADEMEATIKDLINEIKGV